MLGQTDEYVYIFVYFYNIFLIDWSIRYFIGSIVYLKEIFFLEIDWIKLIQEYKN